MKITVIGAGYVGLISSVFYAELGHQTICLDTDLDKIAKLNRYESPIYEPGLELLLQKNIENGKLRFTDSYEEAVPESDIIVIAVGTPSKENGMADISFVESAALSSTPYFKKNAVLAIKSTVPVGTGDYIEAIIQEYVPEEMNIQVVSNPEFLREGSAIHDTFNGDRIIIGANQERAARLIQDMHEQLKIPVVITDRRSSEMIKYASNAFLATKISFVNEIANLCEMLGANIDKVTEGMGMDHRISPHFLKAGIGYGGSCFPKDTKALIQIAGNMHYDFELLRSVVKVNEKQQISMLHKAISFYGSLKGLRFAVLGLSFKPNTDDMREAPSIRVIEELMNWGAQVVAYDPIASSKAQKYLHPDVKYAKSPEEALQDADGAFILTEWDEIKKLNLSKLHELMKTPTVFDGRNCFKLSDARKDGIDYISVGRPHVKRFKKSLV